ncbi:Ornithine decarboxylase [Candidatus Competibacter denitrificans Run_A_D11]|uniref:ornithine decarboxylase n=1 Tax=Candidatus Competibacter denitrificans Run_A_D11 TaxID=1400863 RepID=W6M8U0_9GAMM|nr:type III PLP-dependent enzyme [Candidatus Competibacter denitrificans]CDI03069.1 Ornithine decarboxylase [Candidatus Competibacter denitrificans Run_A_D11]HAS86103.1 type III PLP-dependent enzyme [Candidatus Competibacteraceae bacterium]HRC68740.1 type III PLP-dependent enzyme [Candidatus Competibacter denitrificans]
MYRNYYPPADWEKIMAFSKEKETPFLVVLLDRVQEKYREFRTHFPAAKIYYAVKANPGVELLAVLRDLGSYFDIASIHELDRMLDLGVTPERLSYGNTIKKAKDIREAYEKGVRLFTSDCEADIRNLAKEAPGSRVFFRLLMDAVTSDSDWPLSRKFGCQPRMAIDLVMLAAHLGLEPYGISFHVGSQQREISAWDAAIAQAHSLFEWLDKAHIRLQAMNMGGGFPADYLVKSNPLSIYAEEINFYVKAYFGDSAPVIYLEPGRGLVGEAGVLVSEVVLISKKSKTDRKRWVYTDVGVFNGLMETIDESIKYPIYTEKTGEEGDVVLAGPTCDSLDILYEDFQYQLPLSLESGDRLYWLSTGAYTTSYSSIEFNGFPPLKTYFL